MDRRHPCRPNLSLNPKLVQRPSKPKIKEKYEIIFLLNYLKKLTKTREGIFEKMLLHFRCRNRHILYQWGEMALSQGTPASLPVRALASGEEFFFSATLLAYLMFYF